MNVKNEISYQIARLFPKMMCGIQAPPLPGANLSISQMFLLVNLREVRMASISELARARRVSLPTITGMVERLIQAGQVERISDSEDRRRVLVRLTDRGKKTVGTMVQAIRKRWYSILRNIPEDDQAVFLRTIRRILSVLEKETGQNARSGRKGGERGRAER